MNASPRQTVFNRFIRIMAITLSVYAGHLIHPAFAADDVMTPIEIPAQPKAIELGTGPLPDAAAPRKKPPADRPRVPPGSGST